jgi:phosphoglycolate phosphatase-like HAD superfamily hydrolase
VDKTEMLRRTAQKHGLDPSEVLMVGDGDVDEAAARAAGAAFFRVRKPLDLHQLGGFLRR